MTTYEQFRTITADTMTNDPFKDLDEIEFDEHEQAEKPIEELPRLYWFNGLPTDAQDTSAVGWHVKAGIDPDLDETMESLNIQRYLVQHKKADKDGKNEPKSYWRLRSCSLFVIAHRLQSALEMNRSDERCGIAFNWGSVYDDHGQPEIHKDGKNAGKPKRATILKMRVFIHELYQRGYCNWFPLTISGFETDEVLAALNEQYRVLEYYSDLRRALGKNAIAPFYLFSIPLTPGRAKSVGEQQGTIYPITAQIPATIDREYLNSHVAPKSLIEAMRTGLLTETIIWSMEESAKVKHGREQLALSAGSASSPAQISSAAHGNENDPFVQQAERTWILRVYCRNDEQKAHDICGHFGVPSTDQLRMSHFRALVSQVQSAQNGQNGQH